MELDVAREVLATTTATTGAEGLTEGLGPVWRGGKHLLLYQVNLPRRRDRGHIESQGSCCVCFLISFVGPKIQIFDQDADFGGQADFGRRSAEEQLQRRVRRDGRWSAPPGLR
jgi:hypothetical protein